MVFSDPGGSDSKESTCNAGTTGDPGWIPGLGRSPGEGNGNPLQYSYLENSMSLVSYSPWGRKEWNTTEGLALSLSFTILFRPSNDVV